MMRGHYANLFYAKKNIGKTFSLCFGMFSSEAAVFVFDLLQPENHREDTSENKAFKDP